MTKPIRSANCFWGNFFLILRDFKFFPYSPNVSPAFTDSVLIVFSYWYNLFHENGKNLVENAQKQKYNNNEYLT